MFMPVGTQATVKRNPRRIKNMGSGIIFNNTYHLQTEDELVAKVEDSMGSRIGIKRFSHGGFQVIHWQKTQYF